MSNQGPIGEIGGIPVYGSDSKSLSDESWFISLLCNFGPFISADEANDKNLWVELVGRAWRNLGLAILGSSLFYSSLSIFKGDLARWDVNKGNAIGEIPQEFNYVFANRDDIEIYVEEQAERNKESAGLVFRPGLT